MSVVHLAERLRAGELSPREAAQAYLDRIEQIDGEVNAYITVRADEALAEAKALESAHERGPLWGVPVAVKDVIDVARTHTTAASRILADNVAAHDAEVVDRLERAGAVVLGKLNTHEFAYGAMTTSPHFGPAHNPWSLDRICGGSSGGSGAAAAADLAAGTLGTDTAGSIRIPSCFCGVTGLRPSTGIVSNRGVVPVSWTLDTVGPIARSAEDCALLLDAIAGSRTELVGGVDGLRVGAVDALLGRADPRVAAVVRAAIEDLSSLGATVEPIEVPLLDEAGTINQLIMLPEAANAHLPWLRERLNDYGSDVRGRLLAGLLLPPTAYVTGQRARRWFDDGIRRIFERVDLLVAPAMPVTAPPIGKDNVEVCGQTIPYRLALIPFNSPWSLAGLPVLSMPVGFVDGLPVGLTLVGRRLEEGTVLRAAHAFQQATDWHGRRPPLEPAVGLAPPGVQSFGPPLHGAAPPLSDFAREGAPQRHSPQTREKGERMSVLIKGGRIITAADDYVGDVFIENETVSLIGESLDVTADKVIDASGKYVLPGAIDPHTHIELPFGGTITCDDFTSGTVSAAFGGTTSLVDFCFQMPGQTFAEALETWHEKIERCPPVIDVGFHMAITDLKEGGTLEDLAKVPDEGVTSYKLFMAYKGAVMVDDETLFKSMEVASETGALVMVHAENGDAIDIIVKRALAEGKTEPKWHALTRPPETEGEATNRAIQLAHVAGAPLYVVHVSCKESAEPIALARAKGWQIWGETCTQYFFIDLSKIVDAPGFEGAKYVYTPPPRAKENLDHLWDCVAKDVLSAVSTDHCPFNWDGQKTLGKDDFSKIPNGGPGIENRLHMLHHFGVRQGRISLNRMVELTSTNVAKLFGLYPRKGTIAAGSDGDVVVWDPEKTLTISAKTHHSNVDYNLFEGTEVQGAPEVVLVRGQVIVEGDELVAQPGAGQFIKRARFGEQLTPVAKAVA